MTLLISLLLALATIGALAYVLGRQVTADGYGHRPPPRSHEDQEELQLRPPQLL